MTDPRKLLIGAEAWKFAADRDKDWQWCEAGTSPIPQIFYWQGPIVRLYPKRPWRQALTLVLGVYWRTIKARFANPATLQRNSITIEEWTGK